MTTLARTAGHRRRILTTLAAAAAATAAFGATADELEAPAPPGVLFLETARGDARASILFLPDDLEAATPTATSPFRRLIVTGAYSSGDRDGPEGFVLRQGEPRHPWPQGWDGLLLVGQDGSASLHDVSSVRHGDARYDLRDKTERRAFLSIAADEKLSAIQSHLLIRDGALDLKPVENAPRFRRRLLFQLADGRIGVFDTSPRSVTLYEAAGQALDAVDPVMAINLDMGAYDFCERQHRGAVERCGLLTRDGIGRLTNLIMLSRP